MANAKPRVKVPKTASKGDVLEIKTLITHKMESGQRKDKKGQKIPRMIINKFTCTYNNKVVFESDWHPAISANPYMAFYVKAEESGEIVVKWVDDSGATFEKSASITVK